MVFNISDVFDELRKHRSVFHSEADLQFAMALAIHDAYPDYKVRLEYYMGLEEGKRSYVDIMVWHEMEYVLIELKYKTREAVLVDQHTKEECHFLTHGARDLGVYAVLHDLARVEEAVVDERDDYGRKPYAAYSILLTNDESYTKPFKRTGLFLNYGFEEGHVFKAGKLLKYNLGERKLEETCVKNKPEIMLRHEYTVHWQRFSNEIPYMLIFEVHR